jgi:membrane protein required for colicin V production
MSVFDLIVLVILIALAFRGWMTGMIAQIVSVGSFAASWIIASRFSFLIAPSIPAEEPWNNIGAMIVLFVITLVAVRLFHGYLEKKIRDWHLAKLNRYWGGFLGLIKGLFLCMILTFFCVMVCETTRLVVFKSKTGGRLIQLIEITGSFIPPDCYELLRRQFDLFKDKVNENEVSDNISPEENSLDKMLASFSGGQDIPAIQEKKETSLHNLIFQGQSLLEKVQNIKKETDNASSLLDAIGRWWSDSSQLDNKIDGTDKINNSSDNPLSQKTSSEKFLPEEIALKVQQIPQPLGPPNVALPPPIIPSDADETAKTPILSSSLVRSDDTLFRRQYSEPHLPITEQSAEQFTNRPTGQPEPIQSNFTDAKPAIFATTPMSIPRSSIPFHFSGQFSAQSAMNVSDRLIDSTSSTPPIPASRFTPKR